MQGTSKQGPVSFFMSHNISDITQQGQAGASARKGIRVLQISDTHLYADAGRALVGLNTRQSLISLLDMVLPVNDPVDLILATGDLVHDATSAGYEWLTEHLSSRSTPVYCLPGNHDIPETMDRHMNQGTISTAKTILRDNWLIVMLNSAVAGKEGGHLPPAELAVLDQALATHPEHNALVCLHHHPVPIGSAWMDSMALDNPADFFRVIDRHPGVKGILWGHIHQTFEDQRKGVRLMGTPSTCIQFTPGQDHFGIDHEPPGARWLELLPDGCIESGIVRLADTPVGLDLSSAGY